MEFCFLQVCLPFWCDQYPRSRGANDLDFLACLVGTVLVVGPSGQDEK